jgi:hypothetical protein
MRQRRASTHAGPWAMESRGSSSMKHATERKHARLGVACHHSQTTITMSGISAHVVWRQAENGPTGILTVHLHLSGWGAAAAFHLIRLLPREVVIGTACVGPFRSSSTFFPVRVLQSDSPHQPMTIAAAVARAHVLDIAVRTRAFIICFTCTAPSEPPFLLDPFVLPAPPMMCSA